LTESNLITKVDPIITLSRADLRGANLWVADLQGSILRDANLGNADLRGTNLQVANLRGTTTLSTRGGVDVPFTRKWTKYKLAQS
jgi:uncharacterized protein YjbI with pentapeptide repeats